MIPSPPEGKPVAYFDTECFPNFWLLKIWVEAGPLFSFSLCSGECFSSAQIIQIEQVFSLFTVISFNGNYYDVPIISAALCGFSCEQLKWLSDEIIVSNRKPWELGAQSEWKPPDHIDVMEVLPGAGSQKLYAGRIHCKTMRDLPFHPNRWLSEADILQVDSYCANDLAVLRELYRHLEAQLHFRRKWSDRYGVDLRSKSDAQLGEAVIKRRCESLLGQRLYKPEIDWNIRFRYDPPAWLSFSTGSLRDVFQMIREAIFELGPSGAVAMPPGLEGLEITIAQTTYRLGIGGLHSKDECSSYVADETWCIRDNDVRGYYPRLIINSGKYPPALGTVFTQVYAAIVAERDEAKALEKKLKKQGDTTDPSFVEGYQARSENEGGKVASNGPFGKLGSIYSILFAPDLLIYTTITGQLALLMLIERHEMAGIQVISANTDGFVIRCRRDQVPLSINLIDQWQKETGLEMETTEYRAIYARDVNNYFAIKTDGEVKRKGKYNQAGLIEKKSPDVEICGDAVAEFLAKGTPILYTLAACRDLTKFVRVQQVNGGAVKLWGHGPRKDALVRDMIPTLEANGWRKCGRHWERGKTLTSASAAYKSCFQPQTPEYLGKVVRWYYGVNAPGPIVYNTDASQVSLSYGAQPCMILPDEFPADIDYGWYIDNCEKILKDIGWTQ